MAKKQKFYEHGLHFECTGCGNCCRLGDGKVYVSKSEADHISEHLDISLAEFQSRYVAQSEGESYILKDGEADACIFLSENRCTIYPVRPVQCRTFPFWPENLKSAYRWKIIAQDCPGIGQGRLFSYSEIRDVMKNHTTVENIIAKDEDNELHTNDNL